MVNNQTCTKRTADGQSGSEISLKCGQCLGSVEQHNLYMNTMVNSQTTEKSWSKSDPQSHLWL